MAKKKTNGSRRGNIRSPISLFNLGRQINACRFIWACRYIDRTFKHHADAAKIRLVHAFDAACRTPQLRSAAEDEINRLWERLARFETETFTEEFRPSIYRRIDSLAPDQEGNATGELVDCVYEFLKVFDDFASNSIFKRFHECEQDIYLLGVMIDRLLRPDDLPLVFELTERTLNTSCVIESLWPDHDQQIQSQRVVTFNENKVAVPTIEERTNVLLSGDYRLKFRRPRFRQTFGLDAGQLYGAFDRALRQWTTLGKRLHPRSPSIIPTEERLAETTIGDVIELAETWVNKCNGTSRQLEDVVLNRRPSDVTRGYSGIWVSMNSVQAGRDKFGSVKLPEERVAKLLLSLVRSEHGICDYEKLKREVLSSTGGDEKSLLSTYKRRLVKAVEKQLQITVKAKKNHGYMLVDLATPPES